MCVQSFMLCCFTCCVVFCAVCTVWPCFDCSPCQLAVLFTCRGGADIGCSPSAAVVAASCNWDCAAAIARFSFRLALAASDGIPDFLVRLVVITTPRREPSGSLISSMKIYLSEARGAEVRRVTDRLRPRAQALVVIPPSIRYH